MLTKETIKKKELLENKNEIKKIIDTIMFVVDSIINAFF